MNAFALRLVFGLAPSVLVGALAACAVPAPDPVRVAHIDGPHAVSVGESIQLEARIENDDEAEYTWRIADPTLATVTNEGVVTGVLAGETVVIARGADTGLAASHVLVVVPVPEVVAPPPAPPQTEAWQRSGHADFTAEAFTHWDEEGEVPTTCARCHSAEGYRDYLGADGSLFGSVESPAPTGSVIRCDACHNNAAETLTAVELPSGAVVDGLGPEARCIVCHQGRSSGAAVDEAIATAAVDDDVASASLGFLNIHDYPAAATLFAGSAGGGYQYEGAVYDTRFRHAPGVNTCVGCHDAHTTAVRVETCATCHDGVEAVEDLKSIRMLASFGQDYDGDGDREEGIHEEIATLRDRLLAAIARYGAEKGTRLCYGAGYPYWFIDSDADGVCDDDEQTYPNRFQSFTPRLLKATYNYQLANKDPGAFAHNAKYIIQLLYDATHDVNAALVVPFDLSALVRNDVGHFNGASEASRRWDADEEVSASCSRCHSGTEGFRFFVQYGVGKVVPETANGLECSTCHNSFLDFADLVEVPATLFAGNWSHVLEGQDNLCATCHAGRASKATYDAAFAAGGTPSFQNVHYAAAAGTLYGTVTQVGYEYDGSTYAGPLEHAGGSRCTTCHDAAQSQHTFRVSDVWEARCNLCHGDEESAAEVRIARLLDYDGDGSTSEQLPDELAGMAEALLEALHDASGSPALCYGEHAHPYWFKDTDGVASPHCSDGEKSSSNRFQAWTPALLKAAHNYQLYETEHGAWVHNFDYVGQLLHDGVVDLSGDAQGLTRP